MSAEMFSAEDTSTADHVPTRLPSHPDETPLAPPSTPLYLFDQWEGDESPKRPPFIAADEAMAADLLHELDPILASSIPPPANITVPIIETADSTASFRRSQQDTSTPRIIHRSPRRIVKPRKARRVANPIPRTARTYRNCSRCGTRNHNRRLFCTLCYQSRADM